MTILVQEILVPRAVTAYIERKWEERDACPFNAAIANTRP
jgi:hypothetical protein